MHVLFRLKSDMIGIWKKAHDLGCQNDGKAGAFSLTGTKESGARAGNSGNFSWLISSFIAVLLFSSFIHGTTGIFLPDLGFAFSIYCLSFILVTKSYEVGPGLWELLGAYPRLLFFVCLFVCFSYHFSFSPQQMASSVWRVTRFCENSGTADFSISPFLESGSCSLAILLRRSLCLSCTHIFGAYI